ncbi:unnamed protein product [Caretta caretta]
MDKVFSEIFINVTMQTPLIRYSASFKIYIIWIVITISSTTFFLVSGIFSEQLRLNFNGFKTPLVAAGY